MAVEQPLEILIQILKLWTENAASLIQRVLTSLLLVVQPLDARQKEVEGLV